MSLTCRRLWSSNNQQPGNWELRFTEAWTLEQVTTHQNIELARLFLFHSVIRVNWGISHSPNNWKLKSWAFLFERKEKKTNKTYHRWTMLFCRLWKITLFELSFRGATCVRALVFATVRKRHRAERINLICEFINWQCSFPSVITHRVDDRSHHSHTPHIRNS